MLLKSKDAQIRDLQANIGRDKNLIHFLEVESKQLETEKVMCEIKDIKARKEARRAKKNIDEVLGTHDDTEEEEEQLLGRRPRTIGLIKALTKEREQETTLVE